MTAASEYFWHVYFALQDGNFTIAMAIEYERESGRAWSECASAVPMVALLERADARLATRIVAEFARAATRHDKFVNADEFFRVFDGFGLDVRSQTVEWLSAVDHGGIEPESWLARTALRLLEVLLPSGARDALEDLCFAHVYAKDALDTSSNEERLHAYEAELANRLRIVINVPPSIRDLIKNCNIEEQAERG